jgi:RNA polymerase sigma-70 factor (ECF subfamily)
MGQLLALPPGTVRSRLARARLALKKILAQDGNFSGFLPSMETKERGGRRP